MVLQPFLPPLPLHPPHLVTPPQRRRHQRPSSEGHNWEGTPHRLPPPPPDTPCSRSPCRVCRHPHRVTGTSRSKTWRSKESPVPHRARGPDLPTPSCGIYSPPLQARSVLPSAVWPGAPPLPAALTGSWQRVQRRCCGNGHRGGRSGRAGAGGARPGYTHWSTGCPGTRLWVRVPHCHLLLRSLLLLPPRNRDLAGVGKDGCGSGPLSREDMRASLQRRRHWVLIITMQ